MPSRKNRWTSLANELGGENTGRHESRTGALQGILIEVRADQNARVITADGRVELGLVALRLELLEIARVFCRSEGGDLEVVFDSQRQQSLGSVRRRRLRRCHNSGGENHCSRPHQRGGGGGG